MATNEMDEAKDSLEEDTRLDKSIVRMIDRLDDAERALQDFENGAKSRAKEAAQALVDAQEVRDDAAHDLELIAARRQELAGLYGQPAEEVDAWIRGKPFGFKTDFNAVMELKPFAQEKLALSSSSTKPNEDEDSDEGVVRGSKRKRGNERSSTGQKSTERVDEEAGGVLDEDKMDE